MEAVHGGCEGREGVRGGREGEATDGRERDRNQTSLMILLAFDTAYVVLRGIPCSFFFK